MMWRSNGIHNNDFYQVKMVGCDSQMRVHPLARCGKCPCRRAMDQLKTIQNPKLTSYRESLTTCDQKALGGKHGRSIGKLAAP